MVFLCCFYVVPPVRWSCNLQYELLFYSLNPSLHCNIRKSTEACMTNRTTYKLQCIHSNIYDQMLQPNIMKVACNYKMIKVQ